jgi:hypothetical protein
MAVGHSDDIELEDALESVFAQCDAGLAGATPRAGLLICTWDMDHEALVGAVRARYPGIELAGSSSAGEMSSVLGFREDSVALALFASDAVEVVAGLGRNVSVDPQAAARLAVDDATTRTGLAPRLCIVMSAIGEAGADGILEALRAALGRGVPIIGGGAAPRDPMTDAGGRTSRQFAGDVVASDALAILLFAGDLAFSFGVDTGWKALGPRATVTRVSTTTVQEIDGRPALEFYERWVGVGQPPIANPLAVFEAPGSERFYLRTPMAYDRDRGAITFYGAVPEGATVQITMAATEQIIEGAKASIAHALDEFPAGSRPEAALLFSCATRKFLLGTRARGEIDLVRDVLGARVPVGGIYCMGEIAPMAMAVTDRTRFHNATLVSILLGSARADGTTPA